MEIKIAEVLLTILIILLVGIICFILIEKSTKKKAFRNYSSLLEVGGRFIFVDGIRLFIREAGEGQMPLLMIHGFLSTSDNFKNNIFEISKSRKVIAVDLPGFGNSDKDVKIDYSRIHMAQLLVRMMNQLGYDCYDLLGHSLGGEIALWIAINYPVNTHSLILVDAAGYQSNSQRSLPPWLIENVFLSYPMQKYLLKMSVYNEQIWNSERFMKAYTYNTLIPGVTFRKFSSDNTNSTLGDAIKTLTMPTLIVWGQADKLIPVRNAERFHNEINNSNVVILPECGHLSFIEVAAQFNQVVTDFLR